MITIVQPFTIMLLQHCYYAITELDCTSATKQINK